MCHFAVFPTRSWVAVSVAQCPGVVVVGNDVEPLSSRAGVQLPGWVEVNHSQFAKTSGRERVCICLQNKQVQMKPRGCHRPFPESSVTIKKKKSNQPAGLHLFLQTAFEKLSASTEAGKESDFLDEQIRVTD